VRIEGADASAGLDTVFGIVMNVVFAILLVVDILVGVKRVGEWESTLCDSVSVSECREHSS